MGGGGAGRAPRARRRSATWPLLATCMLLACGGGEPEAPEGGADAGGADPLQPPRTTGFGKLDRGASDEEAGIVARVDGTPIPAEAVQRVRRAQPQLSAREALNRLVEQQILARRAVAEGLADAPRVVRAWRRALARSYLGEVFEPKHRAEDIPDEEVRRVYEIPRVRERFDHADAWRMAHLFITCCSAKTEDCSKPEVQRCFREARPVIQRIYRQVKTRAKEVEGDPERVVEVMKAYRRDVAQKWPQLAYRDRSFYYEPELPHEEQSGYDVLDEIVARTVIDGEEGMLQEPVRSDFGWHILVQLGHEAEEHRTPDDPEVARTIRKRIRPKYRKARFGQLIGELARKWGVRKRAELLEALGGPSGAARPEGRSP